MPRTAVMRAGLAFKREGVGGWVSGAIHIESFLKKSVKVKLSSMTMSDESASAPGREWAGKRSCQRRPRFLMMPSAQAEAETAAMRLGLDQSRSTIQASE